MNVNNNGSLHIREDNLNAKIVKYKVFESNLKGIDKIIEHLKSISSAKDSLKVSIVLSRQFFAPNTETASLFAYSIYLFKRLQEALKDKRVEVTLNLISFTRDRYLESNQYKRTLVNMPALYIGEDNGIRVRNMISQDLSRGISSSMRIGDIILREDHIKALVDLGYNNSNYNKEGRLPDYIHDTLIKNIEDIIKPLIDGAVSSELKEEGDAKIVRFVKENGSSLSVIIRDIGEVEGADNAYAAIKSHIKHISDKHEIDLILYAEDDPNNYRDTKPEIYEGITSIVSELRNAALLLLHSTEEIRVMFESKNELYNRLSGKGLKRNTPIDFLFIDKRSFRETLRKFLEGKHEDFWSALIHYIESSMNRAREPLAIIIKQQTT
ncbi:MAG: hypothetical protein ARM1_0675 [Candidatus Micrarchaeota archaeon]|nr:MAG: hypothetical protein ARM1_0675 [Candidatus Micrarchaeota archaeon]